MKETPRYPLWLTISVAVPLLVIASIATNAAWRKHNAPSWRLPVAAYDPRDLLRGRYLNVRLSHRIEYGGCSQCCICLPKGDMSANPPLFRASACDTLRPRCDQWMTTQAMEAAYRYFIPEARAQQLEAQVIDATRDGKAHVHFVLDARHVPQLTKLTVYGEPLN